MKIIIFEMPPLTLVIKQDTPAGPWTAIVGLSEIVLWRRSGIGTRGTADLLATRYMSKIIKTEPTNN